MHKPESSTLAWALGAPGALGRGLADEAGSASEADTLALLLPAVRKLAKSLDPRAIDRDAEIPRSVLAAAGEAGLFALTIPEDNGGLGLSLKASCRVVDEMARTERSVAIMVGLHAGLGTRGMTTLGSPELQAKWLPRLASGECIASFCATETGAGSDLMAVSTTGRRVADGLLISGEKSYVTNGGFAGLYTVLVRTPHLGKHAQSLVCIPAGSKGVVVGAEEDKLGIRGSSTVTLHFEDVHVPDDYILGEPGKGADYAHALLAWGRTLMSGGCVGIAHAALAHALAHVSTRKQFGKTLSEFTLVRGHIAHIASRIYAMESMVRMTGCLQAEGRTIDALSALTKVFCSETAFEVSDLSLQLHGALGFLEPTGIARALRDCRITRIFEGANDVLLLRIGASIMTSAVPAELPKLRALVAPELASVAQVWDELAHAATQHTSAVRALHGISVVRRQLILARACQVELCLHAALGSILRANAEATQESYGLGEHAARTLLLEAEEHLRRLADPQLDEQEARAAAISERLYVSAGQRPSSRTHLAAAAAGKELSR